MVAGEKAIRIQGGGQRIAGIVRAEGPIEFSRAGWDPSDSSVAPTVVIRLTPNSPSQYSDITRRVDIGIFVARDIGTIHHFALVSALLE